jgi:hypothetical protein
MPHALFRGSEGAGVETKAFILEKYLIGSAVLVLLYLFAVRPLFGWMTIMERRLGLPKRTGPTRFAGGGPPLREGAAGRCEALSPTPPEPTPAQRERKELHKVYEQMAEFVTWEQGKTAELLGD